MNSFPFPDATAWHGTTPLPHLGVIQALGPDAASFLHGQLSQDTQNLDARSARRAAYCSVKGRMLADALVLRPSDDQVLLIMGADVLPATLKKLSMFVMRAKAKLSEAQDHLALVGLVGAPALAALGPEPVDVHGVVRHAGGSGLESEAETGEARPTAWVVRLTDVLGAVRALWIGPPSQVASLTAGLPLLPEGAWAWLDVMSGVPRIELPTVDQFVPQMVNFELVGGINFKKGCYPGQEIVARSQYRGTLKRRLFLVHGDVALQPGQEIFSAGDPGQPAGVIVNAAPVPATASAPATAHWSALAELKLQYTETALTLGSPDGAPLHLGTLPYTVATLDE
ncbi:MAG: folate-binding protein [Rubrivivax sp.]|nr:MAG: folate-binding protein [Rubrivivax sp.]